HWYNDNALVDFSPFGGVDTIIGIPFTFKKEPDSLNTGNYYLEVVDSNNCITYDYTFVPFVESNKITIDPPSDSSACYNDEITLDPTVTGPHNRYQWTIAGINSFLETTPYLTIDAQESIQYEFMAYNSVTGCAQTREINLLTVPEIGLDLGNDTSILAEGSIYLLPKMNFNLKDNSLFYWAPNTYLSNYDELNPTFAAAEGELDSITYTLTVTTIISDQICFDYDDITIAIVPKNSSSFASAFTPNGDGINDDWVIHPALIGRVSVTIFNRWGQKVFESPTYDQPWNGVRNNKELPVGTYYYLIQFIGEKTPPIKGTVTIVR
ncbi:MAG: gliding motility-associated C-terminal domain-containing protein, partial [Bacteroidales bacterium]|nr:gliding motility-associated C-terminal domain-containing protein [Bacteroidales bacterium]